MKLRLPLLCLLLCAAACGVNPSPVTAPAGQQPPAPPAVTVPAPLAAVVPMVPLPLAVMPALPAGIVFTSDVFQVGDLVAALQRRPAPSPAFGELAASLVGGVSANKPLAEAAAALLDFERRGVPLADPQYVAIIANWRRFYAASRLNWMGDEFFSCIYSSIHFLSNVAVVGWSSRNGGLLDDSRWWVAQWWHLADLMATPQGYLATIGERCGGHATMGRDRAILSYLYAVAGAAGSDLARAEGWCQQAGCGLRPHGNPPVGAWEFPASQALAPVLATTYRERALFPLDARFEQPLFGVRTAAGDFAYWIGSGKNYNTPPVLAVVYLHSRGDGPGAPQYLPANGGVHFRQQPYVSTCTRFMGVLVLTSTKQGNGTLALPPGPLIEATYGGN
jgi:hypothetical protein